jgi:threonine dehydratase
MRNLGAEVRLVSGGYEEAEKSGLEYARKSGANWISPYNDGQVIAGQGTLALEILRQQPELKQAAWIVPVGGGGLISGIGVVLETEQSGARVIGVQSEASPFFHALFNTGSQQGIKEYNSLADGLAGPVEEGSITVPLVLRTVQDIKLVSEEEVAAAIAYAWHQHKEIIEGSAAVTLAAVITGKIQVRPSVLIISGGNIQAHVHAQIIQKYT